MNTEYDGPITSADVYKAGVLTAQLTRTPTGVEFRYLDSALEAKGAGNTELQRILQGFRQRVTLARASSLSVPGRGAKSIEEVRKMVDAITARDTETAVQASITHVEEAARVVQLHRHDGR